MSKRKPKKPTKLVAAVNRVTEANSVPTPEILRKLEYSVFANPPRDDGAESAYKIAEYCRKGLMPDQVCTLF